MSIGVEQKVKWKRVDTTGNVHIAAYYSDAKFIYRNPVSGNSSHARCIYLFNNYLITHTYKINMIEILLPHK